MRMVLGVFVAAFALAACGSEEPEAITPTSFASTSTTTTPAPASTVTETSATSTAVVDATSATVQRMDVEFSGGAVSGPDVIQVDLGETVDVWVVSDVDDQMHVHGYDLLIDLVAGEPFHLSFLADVPGIFEVEVHTGHTVLFELRVEG